MFINAVIVGYAGKTIDIFRSKSDFESTLNSLNSLIIHEKTNIIYESSDGENFDIKVTSYYTDSFTLIIKEFVESIG